MLYELREYRLKPGTRARWVQLMQETIIPFQRAQGMVVVGSFTATEDPDLYIWMRRFDDEAERQRQYEAVYKSSTWLEQVKPQIDTMLLREVMRVVMLEPTSDFAGRRTLDTGD
jgi:hypothetical protein